MFKSCDQAIQVARYRLACKGRSGSSLKMPVCIATVVGVGCMADLVRYVRRQVLHAQLLQLAYLLLLDLVWAGE